MIGLGLLAAMAATCAPPSGWETVGRRATLASGTAVVFGELHGTREGPAMVGDVACALATRREPVLLAIEFPVEDNAALQAAWKGPHADFAATLAQDVRYWRIGRGGPASTAVFDLLVRLHALVAAGAPIEVAAFNGPRDDAQKARVAAAHDQGPWEAVQAENIDAAARSHHGAHLLVLVGNLHARREVVTSGGTTFDPMVRVLARLRPVIALDQRYAGGEAYNCVVKQGVVASGPITGDMLDCGPHAELGNDRSGGRPRLLLNASPDRAYDGTFYVGMITASPPLVIGH